MRPLRNIHTKQAASHAFSFSRNVSSQPQFFSPSYLSPKDLIKLNEVGFKNSASSSKNGNNRSIFKYVAPALSVTKNYNNLVDHELNSIGENLNTNENVLTLENNLHHFINKSFSVKVNNKNNHINISIDSINSHYTVLNVRRANSNIVRQIAVSNNLRTYSTLKKKPEHEEQVLIENLSHLKIDEINEVKYDPNDPVQVQNRLIDQFIASSKYNEILPLFNRMRNNDIIPSLEIYNKVLSSIEHRQTDENLETRLTHLLNIYSDILSNNIKPSMETYNIVIDQLLQGSIKSYNLQNYKNGYDFFKIAYELFVINQKNGKYFSTEINMNILACLNFFKIKDLTTATVLLDIMEPYIDLEHKLEFYLKMIKFSSILSDVETVELIYNNKIKPLNSIDNHNLIYQCVGEAYNLSNRIDKSSLMLDTIINNLANKDSAETQKIITDYLSVYIKSLSIVNPYIALQMVYKFNKIEWLPDFSIDSLIILSNEFLKAGDLDNAIKVWDLVIMRSDISTLNHLPIDDYSIFISNYFNLLTQTILMTNNKNLILKITREILNFNNLKINNENLVNLIYYLKAIDNNLTINLILNQGYKRINDKQSLNNYISLIVDLLTESQKQLLFNSKFFKRVIEEFRLVNDNIYGILKLFQSDIIFDELKLKYYSKVLDYEFNDADNVYVKLPIEVQNFKQHIQRYLSGQA